MKLNEILSKDGIIFLTGPFTHPDRIVRIERFDRIAKVASKLMNLRYNVFSPVTQNFFIDVLGTPDDHEYWNGFAEAFLKVSAALVIIRLNGWEQSKGLVTEQELANKHKRRTIWIDEELNVVDDSAAGINNEKVEDEKVEKLIKLQNKFHNTVQKEVKKIDREERPFDILRNPKLEPLHLNENLKTR